MRLILCTLLAAACVLADESEDRRSKLPYIADAVGNTLPPPSNGPATVGSPVNLLTPDRYEFYTFDESGELVKRLMTLEEIQAIVAAGEETEGLVTFANENQPTIAFNFSQPPYTKVHSVVTNVQNVLKAQMEAHKNKPLIQPTLDTPDVSDSWSLILPSIFGNTGVDIVPDKTSGSFTTPETETIELEHPTDNNSLSKEGTHQILSTTSTKSNDELKEVAVTEKISDVSSTTEKLTLSSTTTSTSISTSETSKFSSAKPFSTTTSAKPTTTTTKSTTTSSKPTTIILRTTTTTSTTTSRPRTTTTNKPRSTTTTKPTTKVVRTTPKSTTAKPNTTTEKVTTTSKETDTNFTKIQTFTNSVPSSYKNKTTLQYEKVSTFIPLSTAAYVTERYTQKPIQTTKAPSTTTTKKYLPSTTKSSTTTTKIQPSITTYKPPISTSLYKVSTPKDEVEKFNATTITTQSISPSTTVSSTEFVSIRNPSTEKNPKPTEHSNDIPEIPLFDVAQSFSQIASDLGGNYQPIPTTSNLLDTTQLNDVHLESKENVEIEIPAEIEKPEPMKNDFNIKKPAEIKINQSEVQKIPSNSKPVETDKFSEPPKVQHSHIKINKPTDVKNTVTLKKPISTLKPTEVKHTENNTDNFIKISTLEPHGQSENKVITSESTVKTDIKRTEESNLEVTTINPGLVSSTIDPVLSESMDDLFSQIVNQAPQSIFEAETHPSTKNQESTTVEVPSISKKDKPYGSNSTSKGEIKNDEESIKIQNKNSETKNVTNNVLKINSVTNDSDTTHKVSSNNVTEETNTNSTQMQKIKENNRDLIKVPETTTKKVDLTIKTTTVKVDTVKESKDKLKIENKQDDKKETLKESSKPKEEVTKESNVTTTTDASLKLESTKNPFTSIKKPESISSVTNKIIALENEKVVNNKENSEIEKISEELQPPKVEEFKKKIQKVNIDDKELVNERNNSWKLISTVSPPKANEIPKDKLKTDSQENTDKDIVLDVSKENQGLEVTTKDLGDDIAQFTELCNELAFRYWQTMTESIEKRRSFILSPYSITSMLAMMFMGARGATSGEMNEILKLDDMVTFNPHFTLKNISDSIETTSSSGVIVSAFVRELFSDRSKGKILTFYKERAQHFYNGHVEEINFKLISDIIRRRTNLLVKRYSWGRIVEYMKSNTITMQPPLAAFSANIFQTDCSGSSVEGRDGEMYFVVSPNVRQRRLVPVPAVVYRNGFLAGYDPALDATAAALGNTNSVVSTLFLMPGQQGNVVHAEDLEALEKRLLDSNPTTPTWNRLLRTLLPRIGLELQIPRFSHKSIFNVSKTLQKMGLKELFDPEHADLGGLNGPSKDLYLSDMVQSTTFVTCGEDVVGEQHHIEEYPESLNGPQRRRTSRWTAGWDEPRDYQRAFHDPHDVGEAMNLPLHLRPRQARLPSRNAQPARLKFDRPFLYFVRHNPSGMILYVGRYNPRLLP